MLVTLRARSMQFLVLRGKKLTAWTAACAKIDLGHHRTRRLAYVVPEIKRKPARAAWPERVRLEVPGQGHPVDVGVVEVAMNLL